MLTPSEIVVSRSKPAERHAAAACDMIPPQDPTPSIMAERFAPGAQRSAGESQPAPRPKGPVPGLIAERTRTPAAGRWLLATSLCVSLVPTAIILALIWQGAIKFPQSGSLPFRFEAEEQAQTQQASLADVPAIAPQRAEAVEVKPEIALSAPTRLEAAPGAAVPFDIAIDSADALPARSVIAVRALPRGATFSQGRPYAETEWNLRPDEIGDLVLKLPESASGSADLRIELMAADGTVLANATTTLAVAPDANAGLILRADEAGRVAGLIAHGEKMIAVGYLAGARAYFKRAAEAGSGEAALKLGATYDPDFIAEIGALGVKADLDQAHAWYERAKQLGVEAAETKLKALREEWNERQESGHAMNEHAAEPDLAAAESAAKAPAGAPVPIDGKEEWVSLVSYANVRAAPSTTAETLRVAGKGAVYRATGRSGNWVQITDPATSEVGWVYSRFIETAEAPAR
ncbi:MAG TPA: SH3 domain-containing protein [Methyloceanibacter sp.]|nr:SH3 domain-containing protein [Methyloceanibacter sp.]